MDPPEQLDDRVSIEQRIGGLDPVGRVKKDIAILLYRNYAEGPAARH